MLNFFFYDKEKTYSLVTHLEKTYINDLITLCYKI